VLVGCISLLLSFPSGAAPPRRAEAIMNGKTRTDFDPRQRYARRIDLAARPGEELSAQCLAEALGKILN
jgi:hypothetical protein